MATKAKPKKTAAKAKAPAKKPTASKALVSKNAAQCVAKSSKLLQYVADGCVKAADRFEQEIHDIFKNQEELTAANLAHIYVFVRKAAEAWYEAGLHLVSTVENLKEVRVPEAFEKEGISSFTLDIGHRVTTSKRLLASIKVGMKEGAYKWLRENQLGDLITETVNASTLSATGTHMLKEGKELPEDYFNAHFKDNTSMTGGKKYKND